MLASGKYVSAASMTRECHPMPSGWGEGGTSKVTPQSSLSAQAVPASKCSHMVLIVGASTIRRHRGPP